MRSPVLRLLAFVVTLAVGLRAAPGADGADAAVVSPEARAVIETAVKAMDPLRKLRHVDESRWRWTEIRGPEGKETIRDVTMLVGLPDSMRIETGAGAAGIDGGKPWSAVAAPAAHVRGAAAARLEERLFFAKILLLRPLLEEPGLALELGDPAGGSPVVVATAPGGARYELGFARDGEGLRLASVAGPRTLPDGSRGRFECALSAFEEMARVRFPTKLVWTLSGGGGEREQVRESLKEVDGRPRLGRGAFGMPDPEIGFGEPAKVEVPARKSVTVAHEADGGHIRQTLDAAIRRMREWGLPMLGPVLVVLREGVPAAGGGKLPADVVVPLAGDWDGTPRPEGAEFGESVPELAASITVRGEYGTVEADALAKLRRWIEQHGDLVVGPARCVYVHDPATTEPADQIVTVRIPVSRTR